MTTEPADQRGNDETGEAKAGDRLFAPARAAVDAGMAGSQTFWRALALALLLHGAMFVPLVGFPVSSSLQKRLGETDGDPNSINVDVIEPAAMPGAGEPPTPPPPPPQESPPPPPVVMPEPPPAPQQPPPAKEAMQEPPKEPVKEAVKEPLQKAASRAEPVEKPLPPADIRGTTDPDGPVADKPAPPSEQAKDQQEKAPPAKDQPPKEPKTAQTAALMKEMTDLFAPEPPRKNAPQDKQGPAQPPQPNAPPRVLDQPPQFQANSSSFARPVDITRSGENDEFGRGVIRALRQTMPPPLGLKARVTIMFFLTPLGEVAEMRLVQGSGYPLVDQTVLFAARNSTFPRPPPGSKNSDRIFLVTYIYD